AGSEAQLSERSWTANVTTLSGDLAGNDDDSFANNGENSYHVVTGASGATLDGFTISAGNANGSGMTVFGAGIYNDSTNTTLSNLIVSSNQATNGGAGVYNNASSPSITNVSISGNQASNGGGIYNDNASSAVLTNVTISGNTASNNGG